MTDELLHRYRDEFLHRPGDDKYWSESYYMDFIDEDKDIQGHVRLGLYPNRERANLWVYVIDSGEIYWMRDEHISPRNIHGLSIIRDDWTFCMLPQMLGKEWTVMFDGAVTKSDSSRDVLHRDGEETELSLEFTFTGRHDILLNSEEPGNERTPTSDRYEQATIVEGSVIRDGQTSEFSGPGERDHSWGRRKWVSDRQWLWISGAFDDGTAYNHSAAWQVGGEPELNHGFWFDGDERVPLTNSEVTATPAFGETTGRVWMEDNDPPMIELLLEWDAGETTIEVEPFATTPIDWLDEFREYWGVLNRSPSHQEKDGIKGRGFLENMTIFPL